jgi:hypothetical protein
VVVWTTMLSSADLQFSYSPTTPETQQSTYRPRVKCNTLKTITGSNRHLSRSLTSQQDQPSITRCALMLGLHFF